MNIKLISSVIVSMCSLALSVGAHAVPVVQVLSEYVLARYHVQLIKDDGTVTTLSHSDNGSLLAGGASAHLPLLRYHNTTDDSDRVINADASALSIYLNTYDLHADATDYDSSEVSSPTYASSRLWAEAKVHWTFMVLGEDVQFETSIFNEYNACFPTACGITSVSLFDLTNSTQVIDLSGFGYGDTNASLLATGHQYSLDARSYEIGHDDADTALFFRFDPNAQITTVPEPVTIALLGIGLLGLGVLRMDKKKTQVE